MKKIIVLTLVAMSLLAVSIPAEAAMRYGFAFGYRGGAFGPPLAWNGFGYLPPRYYVGPAGFARSGELKIDTNAKNATVYINGAYAGTVKELKTVRLLSGTYNIEVRNTDGGMFDEKVFVPIDKKIVIEPVFTIASR